MTLDVGLEYRLEAPGPALLIIEAEGSLGQELRRSSIGDPRIAGAPLFSMIRQASALWRIGVDDAPNLSTTTLVAFALNWGPNDQEIHLERS